MPRDQETSIGHDPVTSDDPLFRNPDDEPGDQSLRGDGDRLRDPFGADENTAASATPIGDELSAGRHTGVDSEPSDTPGEWVAGPNGPGHTPDDTEVADDTASAAPETTSATSVSDGTETTGSNGTTDAGGTTDATEPAGATWTTGTNGTTEATGTTDATPDLRATHDPEVAPDTQVAGDTLTTPDTEPAPDTALTQDAEATSDTDADSTTEVAPGAEVTPDTGFPVQTATTAEPPAAAATAATAAPASAGSPVPGAPGTGSTAGVEAASAALVTNGTELHEDWARIQSSFVDDPQGSVSQAADLVAQVAGSLVTAVQERERTLRGEWDGRSDSDTENLRNALRDYRAFFELLIKL